MRLKLFAILLVLTLLTGCAGPAFNQVKNGDIYMIEVKGRNGSGSLNFSVLRGN